VTSGSAQVAVLGRPGYRAPRSPGEAANVKVPAVRLAAFAALALYGVVRWSTLLTSGATARLLGLLALAVILAGARPPVARRSRVAAAALTVLILIAALPMSGIPLAWVWHVRIAVAARAVGDGLSTLPQISVPYGGGDRWVRLDMLLGAAILLFDAALLLAFAPREMEELRRLGVALPLVALAAVPLTAVHASLAYVDGVVLFVLLAAFVWADRIGRRQAGGAFVLCAGAVIVAAVVAPALDRHRGWIDYQALAGSLAPQAIDAFNWSQTYGPVDWPRHGRAVLAIEAARAEYWKTEDLDVFDGRAWTQGIVPGDQSTPRPSPAAVSRWSQTIQVTIKDMRSTEVIGAGLSQRPVGIPHPVLAGFGAGTWTTGSDLEPGDTYTVGIYAPDPAPAQLGSAGTDYSGLASGYRTLLLPPGAGVSGSGAAPQIVFPTFHSTRPVENVVGPPKGTGAQVLERSPYAGVYRKAQRLARSSATPYAFVLAVEHLLARGYTYSEKPPLRSYPLVSFLLTDHRGYCQQFAGAMALLLRMGGVPARVAVGFTPGNQAATHTDQWLVTDTDAHAWVEAWFPHYGWVRFDPTPPADPALAGRGPAISLSSNPSYKSSLQVPGGATRVQTVHPHVRVPGQQPAASSANPAVLGAAGGAVLVATAILLLLATRPLGSPDALVAELERALVRSGRPLGAGATLAEIERDVDRSGDAAAYVRMLRLARFGGRRELPGQRERRALRRHLAGRGPVGALRALWALPPRRRARPARAGRVRGT
jgi:hypothetical protein